MQQKKVGQAMTFVTTVKPVLSGHPKRRPNIGFQDQLSHNAGQKNCRMLQGEHSAKLWTFINPPFAIKTFVLSILEWPLKTGFAVLFSDFSAKHPALLDNKNTPIVQDGVCKTVCARWCVQDGVCF